MRHTIRFFDADRGLYFYRVMNIGNKELRENYRFVDRSGAVANDAKKALRLKSRPRVWELKPVKPPEVYWLLVTLKYESPSRDRRAWFVDLIEMSGPYERPNREIWLEHRKYCFEYLARAFTYCIRHGKEFRSTSWEIDLSRYEEYPHTQDILDNMGLEFIGDWQDSGSIEENMILRRYGFEFTESGYRQENRRL